ncbi:MAG TPA: (5-formylfuran-3-yl)methyl phosphate synthase [Burkholderiales bacterium]|nr:(5-formylfuran-3-yl)methyl phosphate synthase [Burkholderiales bacterium]
MTAMLASVRTLDEALFALEAGADLIDLKEPSRGALGALDHAAVRVCVQAIGGRRPVSATIGDLPSMDPQEITAGVERMAATGVDYIKIGFFAHPRAFDCANALIALARKTRLVAVMFADETYDLALVDALAKAAFAGAMLDTAHKTGKALRDWRKEAELREFVKRARAHGLLTGLAGSLRKEDIAPLLAIEPDYLGFRGALCSRSKRNQNLDAEAFARIRSAIPDLECMGVTGLGAIDRSSSLCHNTPSSC